MRALLSLAAVALVVAACGGSPSTTVVAPPPETVTETTPAQPTATAEVFLPQGPARATVVLLHGWNDLSSEGYRAWIDHLVATDVAVIFPDYQAGILSLPSSMIRGTEDGIRDGLAAAAAGGADGPVIAAGYSLGGGLAVTYAAFAGEWGVTAPVAVYAVFPADPPGLPARLPAVPETTEVEFVVGDRDTVVGREGADALARRIRPLGVKLRILESSAALVFDHAAPKRVDAGAQAAFWKPLDAIVDRVATR